MTEGIHAKITIDSAQFESGIKRSERSSKQFERALGKVSTTSTKADSSLDSVGTSAKRAGAQFDAASKQANNYSVAANKAAKSSGNLGHKVGQLGFQMQDVAVQLGAGTNAGIVLAQQGSQIASVFGPGGAVIGALIAVAGVAGTTLYNALNSTSEEMKEFDQDVKLLNDDVVELTGSLKSLTIIELQRKMVAAGEAIDQTTIAIQGAKVLAKENIYKDLSGNVSELEAKLVDQQTTLQKYKDAFADIAGGTDEASASVRNMITALEDEVSAYTRSARAIAIRNAQLDGASPAEIREINNLYNRLEAMQALDAEAKRLAKSERQLQALRLTVADPRERAVEQARIREKAIRALEDISDKERQALLSDNEKKLQDTLTAIAKRGTTTRATNRLNSLIQTLGTEEDRVRQSYNKRNTDILNSTSKGSEQRAELLKANEAKLQEDLLQIQRDADLKRLDDMRKMENMRVIQSQISTLEGGEPLTPEDQALQRVTMFREITGVDSSEGLEKENELHRLRMEQIATQREEEMIGTQEFNRLLEEEEARHMDALNGIRHSGLQGLNKLVAESYGKQAGDMAASLKSMLSSMSTHSKAAFKINKGLSLADAIVKGYDAATAAWAYGMKVGGPPAAAAFAGASIAKTGAQIAAIKSTQFSGSGSVSGGGATSTGTTTPTVAEAPQENRIVSINLAGGDLFSGDQVRDLIGAINEELDAGLDLRINP